jgi:hypothetical protein
MAMGLIIENGRQIVKQLAQVIVTCFAMFIFAAIVYVPDWSFLSSDISIYGMFCDEELVKNACPGSSNAL